ncbi:MAG: hypothetical protein ACFFEF_10565 [Candidatus Thorarchaeota archaeon]
MYDSNEDFDEFEDDEYDDEDDTFPDDNDSYEERSYATPAERVSSFVHDPWPKTAFILIVLGLSLSLLTPPAIWSQWVYYLLATYLLLVLVAVASINSIKVWTGAEGSRLRWGGLTNLIVVIVSAAAGVWDAILMITTGVSLIPGSNTSVILLAAVIVAFSIYTLWLIQRTFSAEPKK